MGRVRHWMFLCVFTGASLCCDADEAAVAREDIDAHVRAQFERFGPASKEREYFGYVYLLDGRLFSAVVRGHRCSSARNCGLDTRAAARLIPAGALVLGEWHTHPQDSSSQLSIEDVRGAHANRHICGYTAYYSLPTGEIYAWDPRQERVPTAMDSRVLVGNYRSRMASHPHLARSW